jgi:hypothetical protein
VARQRSKSWGLKLHAVDTLGHGNVGWRTSVADAKMAMPRIVSSVKHLARQLVSFGIRRDADWPQLSDRNIRELPDRMVFNNQLTRDLLRGAGQVLTHFRSARSSPNAVGTTEKPGGRNSGALVNHVGSCLSNVES